MTDMVERMARAVLLATLPREWEEASEHDRQFCMSIARAVIAAMREPTGEMIEAGWEGTPDNGGDPHPPDETWRHMIDAVLLEKAK